MGIEKIRSKSGMRPTMSTRANFFSSRGLISGKLNPDAAKRMQASQQPLIAFNVFRM